MTQMTFEAEDLENVPDGAELGLSVTTEETVETPAEPQTSLTAQEFRYGDDAPEQLRGKTAAEAAQLLQQAQQAGQELWRRLQQQQPTPPAQAPAAPNPDEYLITEDDLIGSDPAVINQKINKLFEARTQPLVQDYYTNAANMTLMQARQHPQLPYFQKYENEILAIASHVEPQFKTNLQTWAVIYNNVVAQKMPEILAEHEARLKSASPPPAPPVSERGTGGNPVAQAGKPSITAEQRKFAEALGVDARDLESFGPLADQR